MSDKVTFLQAVMELPRLLPEVPLAPPCWAAGTSHISGDSELLFMPKHKREHIPVSPLRIQEGRSIMELIKKSFQIGDWLPAANPPADISMLASLL